MEVRMESSKALCNLDLNFPTFGYTWVLPKEYV